jgi:hypothetical protein
VGCLCHEEGLLCPEHDRVLRELKARLRPVLDRHGESFGWTSTRATYEWRIDQEAKDLFGADG